MPAMTTRTTVAMMMRRIFFFFATLAGRAMSTICCLWLESGKRDTPGQSETNQTGCHAESGCNNPLKSITYDLFSGGLCAEADRLRHGPVPESNSWKWSGRSAFCVELDESDLHLV